MPTPTLPSARAANAAALLPVLALPAAVLFVWFGALGHYFAQDDFACLARAAGLWPRLEGPWRLISAQTFFDFLYPAARLAPLPYHVASLIAHAACGVLLYRLLALRLGAPAAFAGAVWFAAHPALFTAVHWVAAIGDPLACGFVLLAVTAWRGAGAARWLAVPCFLLALLSKESALPLPLALLALERAAPAARSRFPARRLDPVWIVLAAIAAAGVLAIVAKDGAATDASRPYALVAGPNLWHNGLTYLGWTVNHWLPTMRTFSDAAEPAVFGWGAAALAAWGLGLASAALRRRGWFAAGLWFFAFLIPVLPLESHTYHYYLTLPLLGAAWCLAIALDAAFERLGARSWPAAAALAAVFALNGRAVVERIATAPLSVPGHLSDPVLDRAAIARRLISSVRAELPPGEPARLMVWTLPSPDAASASRYLEDNLKSAVYGGLGLRVMLPEVVEVEFSTEHRALPAPWRWVLARSDGAARVLTPSALDSLVAKHGPPR